jgi:hypothetical protein
MKKPLGRQYFQLKSFSGASDLPLKGIIWWNSAALRFLK